MNKIVFIANPSTNFKSWNYIIGDHYKGMSIATDRYYYLDDLSYKNSLKIALRDPDSNYWTKWVEFPGPLWEIRKNSFGFISSTGLTASIDVHRSILNNEIIIESDYPTYEENYDAARLVGQIIEDIGFKTHYYYSGNKSVHIHVFFSWDCLKELDLILQDQLKVMFRNSKLRFEKRFMKWLRTKLISGWDTNIRKFDKELINSNHLIRCELSKNKIGYKTFLGYTYKDLSFVPYICNEDNRIYPKLGKIKLSSPDNINNIINEFIKDIKIKTKIDKSIRKNQPLSNFSLDNSKRDIRECVKLILSEDFKKVGDGYQRSFFILLNELRRVLGDSQAKIIINDWNVKMGLPIKESDIEYRLKKKNYYLSCSYIHDFLKELGINVLEKCKHKV